MATTCAAFRRRLHDLHGIHGVLPHIHHNAPPRPNRSPLATTTSTRRSSTASTTTPCSSDSSAPLAKKNILGLTPTDLKPLLTDLPSSKSYTASQILRHIYTNGLKDFESMTNLSKGQRKWLGERFVVEYGSVKKVLTSTDGTKKYLLNFGPKSDIETVFIPDTPSTHRTTTSSSSTSTATTPGTLCISSQVGCSLSCTFCRTGSQKLLRNLTSAEILAQILHVMHDLGDYPSSPSSRSSRAPSTSTSSPKKRIINNIVLMGQGEPLLNFRSVSTALKILTSPPTHGGLDLPPWRITLSTSGIAPLIPRVASDLGCGLAISLHATTDTVRDQLVPLNKQYPISEVLKACEKYLENMSNKSFRHRRITFEYVMLDSVNDSLEDAHRLVNLLRPFPAHVNLIPWNPWDGAPYKTSPDRVIQRFSDYVRERGVACTVRTPRGRDIMAACGQLKSMEDTKRVVEKRRVAMADAQ
ncbi:hypothetical protein HK102_003577 [Quaeritorhiza haematococci]|nr:hypothetical protein HK102_003577 [Quaeritorhiza haematococci]